MSSLTCCLVLGAGAWPLTQQGRDLPLHRFMKFEVEEKIQQLHWLKGSQCRSPAVPPEPDPPGLLIPEVVQEPAPAVQTVVLKPAIEVSQVDQGGWTPNQPPPAPPLVARITLIMAPVINR
ncbi:hypothetical protein TREES_T100016178 [Tupaia chinensis]|uniref:Nuclear Testis protein N-terminal domain-containing protein n=1 Tax=Tupaia chinensis TaxID=246437 RepID=L9JML9_TUPCH|nr:hypothetical protein TREES_T100016178 [Tupaia chinensis]